MAKDLETLTKALDLIELPIILFNSEGSCLYFNPGFYRLTSYSKPFSNMPHLAELLSGVSTTANLPPHLFSELLCGDERKLPVKIVFQMLNDELSVAQITEGGVAENLLHAQRLETLGMLAGGIAHDFNNVLAGILGHVTYLKAVLPKDGRHIESLNAVEEGSNKASMLTREIVNFSRLDDLDAEYAEISEVVEKTRNLLRGALPPRYEIILNLPAEPFVVGISEGKLAQIIVNLAMNAKDAIDGQGKIEIAVEEARFSDEPLVVQGVDLSQKPLCVLKVSDNGEGIPPELIEKVCKPYFSTKKDKGTGLGLATVSEIVRKAGGHLHVASDVGKGTSISVYIPLCGQLVEKDTEADEEETLLRGDGRILVVDDEDAVRNVVCMSLQHVGYEVVSASGGEEALGLYKADPSFDLVILDMLMPGLTGEETYMELKKIKEDIKVLFISGYTSEVSVHNVMQAGGSGFLQKPFTIEQLAKKVLECL